MQLIYKNIGQAIKTFHGVTFNPGEVKEVSDYISDKKMIKLDASAIPVPKKVVKTQSDTTKEDKAKEVASSDSKKSEDSKPTTTNKEETQNG